MATLLKIPRKSGISWKAIIKKQGRVLKTKTFRTKTAASAWAKRIENDVELLEAFNLPAVRITFNDLVDEYLLKWQGKDSAHPNRVKWWCSKFGATKLTDITSRLIRGHINAYAEGQALRCDGVDSDFQYKTTGTGRQRSPATVNRMRAALSSVMKYAVLQGYLHTNPVLKVAGRTESNQRVRWLSDDERSRLLRTAKECAWPKMYALILLAITTGARKGELMTLRWSDIDFDKRTALIKDTKNGDDRVLTIPPVTIQVLHAIREAGNHLLFGRYSDPYKPAHINKHWLKVLKVADIKNFKFHDLRHTAASYLVMNGATLYEAGQVLGHKSLQTTQRYAHLSSQHKQALTDRVFSQLIDEI